MLFDGASLGLYVIGAGVYLANIVKGMRVVSAGVWDEPGFAGTPHEGFISGEVVLGREESLKVLSASNTILALVLVGVLVLQIGQWWAENREKAEVEVLDKKEAEQGKNGANGKRKGQ